MSLRWLVPMVAALSLSCVTEVRGARIQKPFVQAPVGTRIALVSIEVPPWVANAAPKGEEPAKELKQGILAAFGNGPYRIVDATGAGYRLPIGPATKPQIVRTENTITEVNRPYAFDADGTIHAVGAPPISWRIVQAPLGFSLDPVTGRINWTPEKIGEHGIELVASNRFGETKVPFVVKVVAPGEVPSKLTLQEAGGEGIPEAQPFTGAAIQPVPEAIDSPLLLGVRVLSWAESHEQMDKFSRRKAITDVVYALFTRSGREVETRRIRIAQIPGGLYRNAVTLVPERDPVMTWHESWDAPIHAAPFAPDELFRSVAKLSALAFAYPYGEQMVMLTVQLDDSAPALKPGLALAEKQDYEGALKLFAEAATADPRLAGAWFDMGAMCELLGRDEEALEHYGKASALAPDEARFRSAREGVARRLAKHVAIELE